MPVAYTEVTTGVRKTHRLKVMKPIILNIAALAPQAPRIGKCMPLEGRRGSETFSPIIQESINSLQRKSVDAYPGSAQADLLPANRWPLYLESLRRALLMKGKSLERIFLKSDDLSLVRRFLAQCGFSEKTVEGFIRELMEENSSREIKLSELFGKLAELGPPNREIHRSLTLEPSIIPYLESVLRDCGLTPKKIEDLFNASRAEGGGLELNKLVAELKAVKTKVTDVGKPTSNEHNLDQLIRAIAEAISRQIPSKLLEGRMQVSPEAGGRGIPTADLTRLAETMEEYNHPLLSQILTRIVESGRHISDDGSGGQVSTKDFTSLRQTTGKGAHKKSQLPPEVMNTIEGIVERATVGQDRNVPAFHTLSLSKLKATNHPMGERTAWQAAAADRGNSTSSLKQEGSISPKSGKLELEPPANGISDRLISDLGGPRWMRTSEEGGYRIAPESKLRDMHQGISSPQFNKSISAVTENKNATVTNALPAYLVDQVGKQLARSLIRGDRVIKIRLKPPELGAMKIEMDMKGSVLRLGMITENSSVKELLLSHVHELRGTLLEQGVKLERLDVHIGYQFSQSLAHSKEGASEGQRWPEQLSTTQFGAEDGGEDLAVLPELMAASSRLLDLIA